MPRVPPEPLLPVYLLTGSDRPKIVRALRRLRARFGEESVELLSAEEAGGADVVAALNALGLFADEGGRLVVVEGVERWKKADLDAVLAYLEQPAPGAVLALSAGEPLKSGALADACARAGQVLVYELPKPRDLPIWARAQLERLGVRADDAAARCLVEIVGEEVELLEREVEKLAAWSGDEPLSAADVAALAVPAAELSAWAFTDAWGSRDLPRLLRACESELEQREPFVLAAKLAAQVGLVRSAQALADDGLSAREIAKRLRAHEFRVRKALAHAENYSRDELDRAVVRLAELDAALKGASRLAGELELERALVEITQPLEAARETA